MIRTLTTFIAGMLTAVALMVAGAAHAGSSNDLPGRTLQQRTICVQEDSHNCAWNAHRQGNGVGYSFYQLSRPVLNMNGHRMHLRVDCHNFVNQKADHRWGECQTNHRITRLRFLGRVDGHAGCWGWVGSTTLVRCRDGWVTTS